MRSSRRLLPGVLIVCVLVSLACVAYPIYVIRPFRAQGASELALALVVSRFRAAVTVLSALIALGATILYWRKQSRRRPRLLAISAACLAVVMAILARINIYEIMFHPIDRPSFAAASEAKLDKEEKVLAVKIGASARAYPIRGLAYHHLANDVVDNTAIVATY